MRNNVLISCALINIGIQWGFFVISAVLKTELLFDIVGSFTFILLVLLSYHWGSSYTLRQQIQTWMVVIWALRLGLYLFTRKLRRGKNWHQESLPPPRRRKYFLWWTLQAARVVVTLLPTLLLNTSPRSVPLGVRDFAGWCLWAVGFGFEFLADHQMATFHSDPANEGKFISSGLWSVSRHPNYFGEILLWLGLYLSASSVLQRTEFLCVLCPIVDLLLLTRVTGVPVLEREGFRRWGNDPAYHEYLRSTALLVPYLW
ncbi:hypothetical protein HPB47_001764 [Ixodes persulcatus]|uniref:Uncharacterized protein n=1 Tax=Ixodes persulcatus TaxID=34615 RepID=A0AC60PPJ3_IXOPE|nr:hypothetical protein HPB47_001764 [Ixodes persulcatus]